MGNLVVNEKNIVIPGEEIANGMDFLPSFGTYRDGESIIANRLGLVSVRNRVIKVIALNGVYMPQMEDLIIGIVKDVGFSGWTIDIGSVTYANLPVGEAVRDKVELLKSDISKFYEIGDIIITKVMNVTKSRIVQLSMRDHGLRKLQGGIIVKVVPQKIPRIIGKQGSMVGMIKEYTKCDISVGQNGFIWICGPADKMNITKRAIKLIEEKSHISGLTDKVKEFLESESK
ncbi:MAG: exosome complex RNA-binding protein Rrp4 [Candidatus Nanoarchaeia archaeon]|nr:exosome complex RNA-binding protein Rrp4 [Candidatus Nanoarchaeia archaeon]MDD5239512.1 exosome complex RNA-binding protein Rrp4 [Candidatus Nanoarchaeia archaeon]